jgi:hypothetical protein
MVDQLIQLSAPLCFDLTVQHICRTTANKIITFDLFLREQHHLGRRIPEEEQRCSFELFFSFCFVCQMCSERRYKKSPFKKIFLLTISLLVLATGEH